MDFKFVKENKYLSIFLCLLFILAVFLRVWKLSSIPPGLSWDEASIGYNAWSVLQVASDEWGEKLPLHFQAFGEWKLPVYIYSALVFIKIFGLNIIAVRLPSIISGMLSAFLFALFWRRQKDMKTALFAGLIFLFSFWGFSLSRSAFEANLAVSILLFFTLSIQRKNYLLSTLSLAALLYTYNGFRLFLPLFLPFLVLVYLKEISFKKLFLSLLALAVFLLPTAKFFLLNRTATSRLSQIVPEGSSIGVFAKNYVDHFQPEFLLAKGDSNLRHFPGVTGQFSWLTVALGLGGLYCLVRKKGKLEKLEVIVLLGLLLSPVPAAIGDQSPHSLRSINFFVGWMFLAVIGFSYFRGNYKKCSQGKKFLLAPLLLIFLGQYIYFYFDYFSNYKTRSLPDWQVGYQKLFEKQDFSDYDGPVFVTSKDVQPYIFYLFYHPQVLTEISHDIAPPSDWHLSRVSRIKNVYFVDKQSQRNYIEERQHGKYIVDADDKEIIPESAGYKSISIDGLELFYIFEI